MDLLEQCELDDEKLMGKSSRQRGPKVGESEREAGRHRNQERGGRIRATRDIRKSAKKSVREIEKEGGRGEAGRQMPGANAHRKHIGRDSEK